MNSHLVRATRNAKRSSENDTESNLQRPLKNQKLDAHNSKQSSFEINKHGTTKLGQQQAAAASRILKTRAALGNISNQPAHNKQQHQHQQQNKHHIKPIKTTTVEKKSSTVIVNKEVVPASTANVATSELDQDSVSGIKTRAQRRAENGDEADDEDDHSSDSGSGSGDLDISMSRSKSLESIEEADDEVDSINSSDEEESSSKPTITRHKTSKSREEIKVDDDSEEGSSAQDEEEILDQIQDEISDEIDESDEHAEHEKQLENTQVALPPQRVTRSKLISKQMDEDEQDEISDSSDQENASDLAAAEHQNSIATSSSDKIPASESSDPHAAVELDDEFVTNKLAKWQLAVKSTSQMESSDPFVVYTSSVYQHLLITEIVQVPFPKYLTEIQGDMSSSMRSILIDWLIEVALEYKLQQQTLYLTVQYIDRFLSRYSCQRSILQLVGMTCMLIASKYWEIYPPTIEDFVFISDHTYTRSKVIEMEANVLSTLKFIFTYPTPFDFITRLIRLKYKDTIQNESQQNDNQDAKIQKQLCQYLVELLMIQPEFIGYKSSIVGHSSFCLSNLILECNKSSTSSKSCLKSIVWNADLEEATQQNVHDMEMCIRDMLKFYEKNTNEESQQLKAVKSKYSQDKRNNVATIFKCPNIDRIFFQKQK